MIKKKHLNHPKRIPKGSMHGIFPYIHQKNPPHVGIYNIHGWYGIYHPLTESQGFLAWVFEKAIRVAGEPSVPQLPLNFKKKHKTCRPSSIQNLYLEDHPRTDGRKWLITMVIASPLSRVVPLPNGLNGLKMGVANHLLTRMILQVSLFFTSAAMG